MKTLLLRTSATSNATVSYTWQVGGIVRRVILTGAALASTGSNITEVALYRGPALGAGVALTNATNSVVAALLVCTTLGHSVVVDVPCWEVIQIGDLWTLGQALVSGGGAGIESLATIYYE